MSALTDNTRPAFDEVILQIADYVCNYKVKSELALTTAKYCLIDSLGCAIAALKFPACQKLLGPWVSEIHIEKGVKVPGTAFELDPIKAAFDIGTMIRWLDYNDTWLAQEWGHPSDNLGAILSVMDFVTRRDLLQKEYKIKDVLQAMVCAYEIQGILALENSFNAAGLDHVILVKLASCALATHLLGGTQEEVIHALSQVWVDGQSLRTYRHAPNTGSRKSWAAGDACSRAVQLALITLKGEKGSPTAISAKNWGFSDASFRSQPVRITQPLGSYVIENILFKIAYPAEFHAQTAVECGIKLYDQVKNRLHEIDKIIINTQAAAIRIINKTGPLYNPADRDHCLQYMVAVALSQGKVTAQSYEDEAAKDPMLDKLREIMVVKEDPQYSQDYLDPTKRSIANRVEIQFKQEDKIEHACEYPLGHYRRREEALPLLWKKFEKNIAAVYDPDKVKELLLLVKNEKSFLNMSVSAFLDQWAIS